jgi:hypothetical protein
VKGNVFFEADSHGNIFFIIDFGRDFDLKLRVSTSTDIGLKPINFLLGFTLNCLLLEKS